jgi:urease accessory protein UreE
LEHHIVRTEEITGYQDTVSRGDIVVLDDKAYVVIYILDQEVTQIDPTIKHK